MLDGEDGYVFYQCKPVPVAATANPRAHAYLVAECSEQDILPNATFFDSKWLASLLFDVQQNLARVVDLLSYSYVHTPTVCPTDQSQHCGVS